MIQIISQHLVIMDENDIQVFKCKTFRGPCIYRKL